MNLDKGKTIQTVGGQKIKNRPRGPPAPSTARAPTDLCCRWGLSDAGMEGERKRKRGASAPSPSPTLDSGDEIRSESTPSHAADVAPWASPEVEGARSNTSRCRGRRAGHLRGHHHFSCSQDKATHQQIMRTSRVGSADQVRDHVSIARNVPRVPVSFSSRLEPFTEPIHCNIMPAVL